MITHLVINNFKRLDHAEISLDERTIIAGPSNSGKTSILQALTLWEIGVKRCRERLVRRPQKSSAVLNHRELVFVPTKTLKQLWHNANVRTPIQICLSGICDKDPWSCSVEFLYANEASFYCRPSSQDDAECLIARPHLMDIHFAYLPAISGLSTAEYKLDEGAINVRLGEGRTAEVLRNLCWLVFSSPDGQQKWRNITEQVNKMFGVFLNEPRYIAERGEIVLDYALSPKLTFDLSTAGLAMKQALLVLAFTTLHQGAVFLFDDLYAYSSQTAQNYIRGLLDSLTRSSYTQIVITANS